MTSLFVASLTRAKDLVNRYKNQVLDSIKALNMSRNDFKPVPLRKTAPQGKVTSASNQ